MANNKFRGITEKEALALDFWEVKELFDRAGVGNFGCYKSYSPDAEYKVGIELREQDCSWSRSPKFIRSARFTDEREKDWYKAKVICDFYGMVQQADEAGVKSPFQENAVALCREIDSLVRKTVKKAPDRAQGKDGAEMTESNMPKVNGQYKTFSLPVMVERKGKFAELVAKVTKGPYDKEETLRNMRKTVSDDLDKVMGQFAVALSDGDKIKESVFRLAVANVMEGKAATESVEYTAQSLEAAAYFEWAGDNQKRDAHLANADAMKEILVENVFYDALDVANKDKHFNMSLEECYDKVLGTGSETRDISIVKVDKDSAEKIAEWAKDPDLFVVTLDKGTEISTREGLKGAKIVEATTTRDGETMKLSIIANKVEQVKTGDKTLLVIDKKDGFVDLSCKIKEKTWVNVGSARLDGADEGVAKALALAKDFTGFVIEKYREDIEWLRKPATKQVNRNNMAPLNPYKEKKRKQNRQVENDYQK